MEVRVSFSCGVLVPDCWCRLLSTPRLHTQFGVDFLPTSLRLGDRVIKLSLWDIAGQEIYGLMTSTFYRSAVGALIVYDQSRPQTLKVLLCSFVSVKQCFVCTCPCAFMSFLCPSSAL